MIEKDHRLFRKCFYPRWKLITLPSDLLFFSKVNGSIPIWGLVVVIIITNMFRLFSKPPPDPPSSCMDEVKENITCRNLMNKLLILPLFRQKWSYNSDKKASTCNSGIGKDVHYAHTVYGV